MRPQLLIALFGLAALSSCKSSGGARVKDDEEAPPAEAPAEATDADTSEAGAAGPVVRIHGVNGNFKLTLRGELPLSWTADTPAVKVDDDTYEVRFAGKPPAQVKPMLNGAWSVGGNYNVNATGPTDIYPLFMLYQGAKTGRVEQPFAPTFYSNVLGNARQVLVYLPPSFDTNKTATYPVLYMHDGQRLFNAVHEQGKPTWAVDETLDRLYAQNAKLKEAIVVAPAHTEAGRMPEYTPTEGGKGGGKGDLYLKFLVKELMPEINKRYKGRVRVDAPNTGLAGSSLGGLITTYAITQYPGTFGFVGILSPSVWWDKRVILAKMPLLKAQTPAQRPARVYIDVGTYEDPGSVPDPTEPDATALAKMFRDLGYKDNVSLKYVIEQGADHSEGAWARRFPGVASFLLAP